MRFSFHGADSGVTGSCHLIEYGSELQRCLPVEPRYIHPASERAEDQNSYARFAD